MHTKSLIIWDPGQKQKFERSLSQAHQLILESLPERQEATGAHPGDIDRGTAIFGSFYHVDSGAGKYHFGILSLAY